MQNLMQLDMMEIMLPLQQAGAKFFDKAADEHIYSQYFDYQFRPSEKLFGTFDYK